MCKQIQLKSVSIGEKIGTIAFTVVGDPDQKTYKAKVWPRAPWSKDLKVGETGAADFETVPGKPKKDKEGNLTAETWPDEKFLHKWNGVECPPQEKAARSGGYSRGKPEQEILAQLAIAALTHSDPTKAFDDMITLVNRGKGKLS